MPDGITPTSVIDKDSDGGACAFADNKITCTYPKIGESGTILFDYAAHIIVTAKPVETGQLTLTANVTANEPDENLSNNSVAQSLQVVKTTPKSRKRVRFF